MNSFVKFSSVNLFPAINTDGQNN